MHEPLLQDFLRFDPDSAEIRLQDERLVLVSARAMGALRMELIHCLGKDLTRGVFKRFGFAAGSADGLALRAMFPEADRRTHLRFGAQMHALEGVTRVQTLKEQTEIDFEAGLFHIEALWLNSYEADLHLQHFGTAREPACWNLAGYASGHSSAVLGRRTLVVEHECRAMGAPHCRFTVDFLDDLEETKESRDYLPKSVSQEMERLQKEIREQAESIAYERNRVAELKETLTETARFGEVLGHSQVLCNALKTAKAVAPVDSTVLLLGESGTGKEVLARAIHQHSSRQKAIFLAVNCSAIPETMQEAELFGYVQGAFTGAVRANQGMFEAADGGTLFLDEIGDLTPSAQTKILRVLQEGEIKRLGEQKVRKVDVRILAATHRDLLDMIRRGLFREDLFYRLEVVSIRLPPLRERENDALLLADHFLGFYRDKFAKEILGFDEGARRLIASYSWPGNVRELRHAVERAVILSEKTVIRTEDLPERVRAYKLPERERRADIPVEDEEARIKAAIRKTGGNKKEAARLLGIGRTTLYRKLKTMTESGDTRD